MSLQLGAEQVPPAPHTLLTQSVPTVHFNPSAHRGQLFGPPQSTSVSLPFFCKSGGLQLGAEQVKVGPHTLLTQSLPTEHLRVSAHRGQVFGPPQSTSVSVPFC
jgi:hypothetical protein